MVEYDDQTKINCYNDRINNLFVSPANIKKRVHEVGKKIN